MTTAPGTLVSVRILAVSCAPLTHPCQHSMGTRTGRFAPVQVHQPRRDVLVGGVDDDGHAGGGIHKADADLLDGAVGNDNVGVVQHAVCGRSVPPTHTCAGPDSRGPVRYESCDAVEEVAGPTALDSSDVQPVYSAFAFRMR